ncbi:MAG: hypothetical protein ACPLW8_06795, partial [Candidatus Bathyarchaeales archaeon]
MKKISIAILMLVWLCFQNFALIFPASGEEAIEYKETMMASVFISIHPGELRLVKNIHLIFDGMDPPINTSIKALNDRFLNLRCQFEPARNGFFIRFDMYFESNIENETADVYADKIVNEMMDAFNYSGLKLTAKWKIIQEERMRVHRSFGPLLPLQKEKILEFLKFAPKDGFGRFINGIIDRYFPGDATTGLYPEYWLVRKDSTFSWLLAVTGVCSDLLPTWEPHDFPYTLSIKELLNTNLSIVEEPLEYQQVIVEIETNHTELLSRGITSYMVNIDDVQPEGYNIAPKSGWPYWVEIKYEHLFPMEDVTIRMSIDSFVQRNPKDLLIKIGIALFIALLALLIVLLWIAKKRKEEV